MTDLLTQLAAYEGEKLNERKAMRLDPPRVFERICATGTWHIEFSNTTDINRSLCVAGSHRGLLGQSWNLEQVVDRDFWREITIPPSNDLRSDIVPPERIIEDFKAELRRCITIFWMKQDWHHAKRIAELIGEPCPTQHEADA